ncbi:MAG: hypothetical protein LAT75_05570 [Candidatus Cyclonatronum sp.]|uniref:hypothetical protein n=1 Tax=Cyclonatronum sp. TaxID=3024185 RepID=UPI0025C121A0|nr:hypothetical protein [Cyclonatronum sp.]MCH8486314.1 hypothetical protein [Cyclonatronum sp.]
MSNSSPSDLATANDIHRDKTLEKQAKRRFKDAARNLLRLLRASVGAQTSYMYWINRNREQLVLECADSDLQEVVFQDRITFKEHFLTPWLDLDHPALIDTGNENRQLKLLHHISEQDQLVKTLLLIPFVNNGETVALSVAEFTRAVAEGELAEETVTAYHDSVENILQTFLDLSFMLEQEERWARQEKTSQNLLGRMNSCQLLRRLVVEAAALTKKGGAVLALKNGSGWQLVFRAGAMIHELPAGLELTEHSQAWLALESGEPRFTLHFNGNPKRFHPAETPATGASLAIPMDVLDFRQGLLLVWDEDPLRFTESQRHMYISMCRVVSLQLGQPRFGHTGKPEEPLLGTPHGAYNLELLEHVLEQEFENRKPETEGAKPWLVMVTPADYHILRTRNALRKTNEIQRQMILDLGPARSGLSGLVAFHSDSICLVYLRAEEKQADKWLLRFAQHSREQGLAGRVYPSDIDFIATKYCIPAGETDVYNCIQAVRKALNAAIKENRTILKSAGDLK